MPTHIRLLTRQDGQAYQHLRLRSLQEHPSAFLATFENESTFHEKVFSDHLDWAYHPPLLGYFGIFDESQMLGYVQVSKTFLEKQEHIVFLNNLYIRSDVRNQGLASQLFEYIFLELKMRSQIERVYISCTASNHTALAFYRKIGFSRYAVRVKAIKWQGEYDDEVEMVKIV